MGHVYSLWKRSMRIRPSTGAGPLIKSIEIFLLVALSSRPGGYSKILDNANTKKWQKCECWSEWTQTLLWKRANMRIISRSFFGKAPRGAAERTVAATRTRRAWAWERGHPWCRSRTSGETGLAEAGGMRWQRVRRQNVLEFGKFSRPPLASARRVTPHA